MSDPAPPPRSHAPHASHHRGMRGHLRRLPRFLVPRVAQLEVSRAREVWLVFIYTARRWIQVDRSTTLASSLALQTVLSIVPFAGLVLTLLGLLGKEQARGFLDSVAGILIPDPTRVGAIIDGIYELARNVTLQNLGIVGFLGSLGGASLLFLTLEGTINDIWRVKFRRSAVAKFTMFYTLTTLAPLIIFFSLGRPIVASITEQGGVSFFPFISTSLAFILLNKFMPATRVGWRAAAIGGIAGAALFELGKRGFALFLANITSYEGTYGALAALPVFCVWAYVSWLIVLFSVELSCVIQQLPLVRREGYVPPELREDADEGVGAARLACRLMLAVCDYYDRCGAGLSGRTLGARFQVDAPRLSSVVNRLEHAGIILHVEQPEAAYLPGRPLDQITVYEIMRLFASRDVEASRDDHLTTLFTRLDGSMLDIFANVTFQELIHEERRRRNERSGNDEPLDPHDHATVSV